jgi:hypothetical protein
LFFISWPSCIVMFSHSSIFDPLMLLPYIIPQFMPFCIVAQCCSLGPNPLTLLH